jgi:hypothetical protein
MARHPIPFILRGRVINCGDIERFMPLTNRFGGLPARVCVVHKSDLVGTGGCVSAHSLRCTLAEFTFTKFTR